MEYIIKKELDTSLNLEKFIRLLESHKGLSEDFLKQYQKYKKYYQRLVFEHEFHWNDLMNLTDEEIEELQHMVEEVSNYDGMADKSLKHNTFYAFIRSYEVIESLFNRRPHTDVFL